MRMSARSFATEVPTQVSCLMSLIGVKTRNISCSTNIRGLTPRFLFLFVCLVLELVIQ